MRERILAFVLAASMLLSLVSCGAQTAATTMKLARTTGTVGVSDEEGQNVTPAENLGLYSGYAVATETESYAWVNLDDVKLTKLNEDTEIQITKDGKKLEIEVKSGALFFNITEPLADDETLDIRSSTMVVGIRGTCGWVSVENPDCMTLYLLEGTVECTAGENSATVTAGKKAVMSTGGEIVVSSFYQEHIPAFVAEENSAGDVLSKVPPLYPLTVLSRQILYSCQDGFSAIQDYFYDEEGYMLHVEYTVGELSAEVAWTYSYDGEGHCWRTNDDGVTYEMPCVPGNYLDFVGWSNSTFSAPLVTCYGDKRSDIGSDGRLDIGSSSYAYAGFPDGCYAIYTMGANNYPAYIETYAADGTLTGTCTLEWIVIG